MKHTTVRSMLLCARRLLIKKGWTQGQYAKLRNGRPCLIDDPKAARFCMIGALERCEGRRQLRWRAENALRDAIGGGYATIPEFNDGAGRTKSQVLSVYDAAIKETRVK